MWQRGAGGPCCISAKSMAVDVAFSSSETGLDETLVGGACTQRELRQ